MLWIVLQAWRRWVSCVAARLVLLGVCIYRQRIDSASNNNDRLRIDSPDVQKRVPMSQTCAMGRAEPTSTLGVRKIIISDTRNIRKRAAQAFSAQFALRLVVIGQQLLLTPLFLSRWGIDGYAIWIAASAIASFASLANGGLGQAASAEIIFKLRANDQQGVIALFSNAMSLLLLLSALWMVITVALVYAGGVGGLETTILGTQGPEIVFLLNIVILQEFICAPFAALLGAAVGAGAPAGIKVVMKLLETISCAALLYFISLSQRGIASVMTLFSLLSFVVLAVLALRQFPWIRYRLSSMNGTFRSTLILPSLNNFLLFVSVNIVGIQLPRIIIPSILSAGALALFATMTTYFRTVRSFCVVLPAALQVEVSMAHGGSETERLKRIYYFTIHSAIWISMLGGVIAIVAGPLVFPLWTRNLISFDWRFGLILFVGVVCSAIFDAITGLLMAVNKLGRMPVVYSCCMLVATLFGALLAPGIGLEGYAAVLIVPDLIGIFLAAHQAKMVTNISVPWRRLLTDPPWREFVEFGRPRM